MTTLREFSQSTLERSGSYYWRAGTTHSFPTRYRPAGLSGVVDWISVSYRSLGERLWIMAFVRGNYVRAGSDYYARRVAK